MKRKFALVACAILFVVAVFGLVACDKTHSDEVPKYTETDLFWQTPNVAEVVYEIDSNGLSHAELETVVSLQGIVAKTSAAIYVAYPGESKVWKQMLTDDYGVKVVKVNDPWKLVEMFLPYIADNGYVLYRSTGEKGVSQLDQSVNYATTVAGADKYLIVSESLESNAQQLGLTKKKDVRDSNTQEIFEEYKNKLTTSVLVHQNPTKWTLRDYAVAAGAMCFYGDYYDGSNVTSDIFAWADDCAPVLGWTENELGFVSNASIHNKITVAADWSSNLSLYSGLDAGTLTNVQRPKLTKQNKHYVAIVMSDGDNVQWMNNGFATEQRFFGSDKRGNFPVTWTIAPGLYNLSPQTLKYLYGNASANDYFIAGPSGVGYVNMTEFGDEALARYSQITASYMNAENMSYLNLLDNAINKDSLTDLAKYDSVRGGVWSVGNMYIEGAGGVYWVNDKPFVAARETLWRIAGQDETNKYYGFVERVAQRINSYKVDPTSIEGYTIVLAHAWSIGSMDYINRFVDYLDDDVELVTVDQMLQLVSENVPHTDKERLDDIAPSDIADNDLCQISSEQYDLGDIDKLPVDDMRKFDFVDGERIGYKWTFGDGGLEYDFAGYSTDGIKLDGSDLNDVVDPMPNSWTVNKFTLGDKDKLMCLYANGSSNCDVNFRVRVLEQVDGKLVSTVLQSKSYEKALDNYGWYKIDGNSPFLYLYDLSAFVGKTVAISLEQDDTGDGSGEVVTISQLEICEKEREAGDITDWSTIDLATYWSKSGVTARHKEGICLESENAEIHNNILIKGNTLKVYMRRFKRPNFEEQDKIGYVYVKINGNIVRVKLGVVDYVEVVNNEEYGYYTFDISAYNNGQLNEVQIVSIAVNGVVGGHICISRITVE